MYMYTWDMAQPQIEALLAERDRLQEQVKVLRDACDYTVGNLSGQSDSPCLVCGTYSHKAWCPVDKILAALAATEEKPMEVADAYHKLRDCRWGDDGR